FLEADWVPFGLVDLLGEVEGRGGLDDVLLDRPREHSRERGRVAVDGRLLAAVRFQRAHDPLAPRGARDVLDVEVAKLRHAVFDALEGAGVATALPGGTRASCGLARERNVLERAPRRSERAGREIDRRLLALALDVALILFRVVQRREVTLEHLVALPAHAGDELARL